MSQVVPSWCPDNSKLPGFFSFRCKCLSVFLLEINASPAMDEKVEDSSKSPEDDASEKAYSFKLSPINSESSGWQEEILLNWNQVCCER